MKKDLESKKFSEMEKEVEAILKKIEQNNIDIDDLVDNVENAMKLIATMKSRLEQTKNKILEIEG